MTGRIFSPWLTSILSIGIVGCTDFGPSDVLAPWRTYEFYDSMTMQIPESFGAALRYNDDESVNWDNERMFLTLARGRYWNVPEDWRRYTEAASQPVTVDGCQCTLATWITGSQSGAILYCARVYTNGPDSKGLGHMAEAICHSPDNRELALRMFNTIRFRNGGTP
jgi:hypothetical protein